MVKRSQAFVDEPIVRFIGHQKALVRALDKMPVSMGKGKFVQGDKVAMKLYIVHNMMKDFK